MNQSGPKCYINVTQYKYSNNKYCALVLRNYYIDCKKRYEVEGNIYNQRRTGAGVLHFLVTRGYYRGKINAVKLDVYIPHI